MMFLRLAGVAGLLAACGASPNPPPTDFAVEAPLAPVAEVTQLARARWPAPDTTYLVDLGQGPLAVLYIARTGEALGYDGEALTVEGGASVRGGQFCTPSGDCVPAENGRETVLAFAAGNPLNLAEGAPGPAFEQCAPPPVFRFTPPFC